MIPEIGISLLDPAIIIPLIILIAWRIGKKSFDGLDMETIKTMLPEIEILAPNDSKYVDDPILRDVEVGELSKDDYQTSD